MTKHGQWWTTESTKYRFGCVLSKPRPARDQEGLEVVDILLAYSGQTKAVREGGEVEGLVDHHFPVPALKELVREMDCCEHGVFASTAKPGERFEHGYVRDCHG